MQYKHVAAILFATMLACSPAFAKEKQHEKHMDEKAMMEEWMKLATPGTPHKQLDSLVGSWTTKTKEWTDPSKPPQESEGTVDMKMLLGGRFLHQEYSGMMMGQPYTGIGITGYDNLRKKYVTIWLDSMATAPFVMEGTASPDGKTITLRGGHDEPGGGHMTHRAVWSIPDAQHQTFEMYGAHGHEKETKQMEILYTRKP
ncbi:MAG: DUF1579 domain-containing protein [Nitrospiraceae bacterium]